MSTYLREHWTEAGSLADALSLAVAALGHGADGDRQIPAHDLEVAVLDRTRTQPRKFRRLTARALRDVLGPDAARRRAPDDRSAAGGGEASHEPQVPDDPADPTDTASSVPPLEDPVTGEPPARRDPASAGRLPGRSPDDSPVAPPLDRDDPTS